MNGPPIDARDEKQAARQNVTQQRERWMEERELKDGQGAARGTGRKERDGGDIEPNALNKASVMELMTGCVPLAFVTRAFARLLRSIAPLSSFYASTVSFLR